jgi:hypothetical protein
MRRTRRHVQPEPRSGIALLPIGYETQATHEDLHDSCLCCLVLRQSLAGVKAEDGHIEPLVAMDHLGHNCAWLDGDGISDFGYG